MAESLPAQENEEIRMKMAAMLATLANVESQSARKVG